MPPFYGHVCSEHDNLVLTSTSDRKVGNGSLNRSSQVRYRQKLLMDAMT